MEILLYIFFLMLLFFGTLGRASLELFRPENFAWSGGEVVSAPGLSRKYWWKKKVSERISAAIRLSNPFQQDIDNDTYKKDYKDNEDKDNKDIKDKNDDYK